MECGTTSGCGVKGNGLGEVRRSGMSNVVPGEERGEGVKGKNGAR
jgi:hypothetical protein